MKQKLLSLLLLLACVLSLAVPTAALSPLPFRDVDESRWYFTYVKELYENGIVKGVSTTSFAPGGTVTLGQALKFFLLIGGYGEQAPTAGHWASGYYELADREGFLGGAEGLPLDQPINRLRVAELAVNVLGLSRTAETPSPFSDTEDLSVLALYDCGVITGSYRGKTLCYLPESNLTRAELSAIVWRIRDLGLAVQGPDAPSGPQQPAEEDVPPTYTGEAFLYKDTELHMAANVPPSPYDNTLFQLDENGRMTYTGSGFTYQNGIDVSKYQGEIDWAAVKEADIQFAIIRLGYRRYISEGPLMQDPYYPRNMEGAIAQNIPVGVYFFSQATSEEEAVEEANFVLALVKDYKLSLPIVFDWEPYPDSQNARTKGLSNGMLTRCAVAFCETIRDAGYEAMVYNNLNYFYLHFDISQFADYPLWLAQYNTTPSFRYSYLIWQHSSNGTVPGIQGDVDMDIMLIPET